MLNDDWTVMPMGANTFITVVDPAPTCIHNQNTIGPPSSASVLFSIFVQMAEGLHFGIVPYVSRPASASSRAWSAPVATPRGWHPDQAPASASTRSS